MTAFPRKVKNYASSYSEDEQERIEARFQSIEQQIGMNTGVVPKIAANNIDILAAVRDGTHDATGADLETVIAASPAISVTKLKSQLDSSSGAITATLAAPAADGQLKLITMSDATNASTVSGTNVDGQAGKTAAFSATTKYLALISVNGKWSQIGGNVTWA